MYSIKSRIICFIDLGVSTFLVGINERVVVADCTLVLYLVRWSCHRHGVYHFTFASEWRKTHKLVDRHRATWLFCEKKLLFTSKDFQKNYSGFWSHIFSMNGEVVITFAYWAMGPNRFDYLLVPLRSTYTVKKKGSNKNPYLSKNH